MAFLNVFHYHQQFVQCASRLKLHRVLIPKITPIAVSAITNKTLN